MVNLRALIFLQLLLLGLLASKHFMLPVICSFVKWANDLSEPLSILSNTTEPSEGTTPKTSSTADCSLGSGLPSSFLPRANAFLRLRFILIYWVKLFFKMYQGHFHFTLWIIMIFTFKEPAHSLIGLSGLWRHISSNNRPVWNVKKWGAGSSRIPC